MGVTLLGDRQQAAFNTREGKAVFQYWVDLYQQGLLPKEVLTQGHRRASELYQSGEIAMLSSGPEFIDIISKNAPEVAKVSGVAPLISGPTGKKNVAVMNLIVPRDTKKPQEALKFALFVTNTENQLAFAKAANVLPSTVKSVEAYKRLLAGDSKGSLVKKGLNISASQLSQAEVLIPPMKDVNALQKAIYGNLQAAMLKEKSVDQAIADAAQEWNEKVGV
jgi:putative chitobiose transport system substrate-binding protein